MKKTKLVAILGILVANSLQAAPILRFFEIQTDVSRQVDFNQTGEANLTQSVKEEAGTLAMFATHEADNIAQNLVLEVYQDEPSYEIHRHSEQYKNYAEMAKTVVKGFKRFETDVQFLGESRPLQVLQSPKSTAHIRLTSVRVRPERNEAFRKIVIDEMQQSLKKESGVWTMYAVTLKEQPNEWRFFEIYADEDAYLAHRETEHFKNYLIQTEKMLLDKNGITLIPDTLMSKGELQFNILNLNQG